MIQSFELDAQPRTLFGKGHSRRLRRIENRVPAILYGGNEPPLAFSLDHRQLVRALENEAFYSHILTINLEQQQHRAILKELQRHAFKSNVVLHLDFLRAGKEKITLTVPLHFIGEERAPGVKHGGIVLHRLTNLEIRCLPINLPESISVDISELELSQSLHLSELQLPEGIELLHQDDRAVVSIQAAKTETEETDSNEQPTSAEVPAINVKENKSTVDSGKDKKKK